MSPVKVIDTSIVVRVEIPDQATLFRFIQVAGEKFSIECPELSKNMMLEMAIESDQVIGGKGYIVTVELMPEFVDDFKTFVECFHECY